MAYSTIMAAGDTSGAALARSIAARLRAHGAQAYYVGGCVRDRLLGREPKDFDVATDAPPGRILELFPDAKLAIGPSIEDGFYYDFDLPAALTPEDLSKIEDLMRGEISLERVQHSKLTPS